MDARITALETLEREIEAALSSADLLGDRDRFRAVVNRGMSLLNLDDADVADKLPVSRSAVNRWKHGNSVPLPMMRKPVYKFLLRKIKMAIQTNDADPSGAGATTVQK